MELNRARTRKIVRSPRENSYEPSHTPSQTLCGAGGWHRELEFVSEGRRLDRVEGSVLTAGSSLAQDAGAISQPVPIKPDSLIASRSLRDS